MKRTGFLQSIRNAWAGIVQVFRRERNFRMELIAAGLAVGAGFFFNIQRAGWMSLIIIILLVLLLETLNSAAEHFLDVLKPRLHAQVKLIKDMMAGAVLLTAVGAMLIGALIFV